MNKELWKSLKVPLIYFFISSIWVIFSDQLLSFVKDDVTRMTLHSVKGILFVIFMAFLLYFILRRENIKEHRAKISLMEAEERYRNLVENSPIAILVQRNGEIIYANPEACNMIGVNKERLIGRSLFAFVHPEYSSYNENLTLKIDYKGDNIENKLVRLDGKVIDIASIWMHIDYMGQPSTMIMGQDISERKRTEAKLKESEHRYRRLVEHSPGAIFVTSDGKYCYVNPASIKLFGATDQEQLLRKRFIDFVFPEHRDMIRGRVEQLLEEQGCMPSFEMKLIRLDGVTIDVEMASVHIIGNHKPSIMFIGQDITERKRNEEKIYFLAHHDPLTELPNRILFMNRFHTAIGYAQNEQYKVAMLFLDMDRFKKVNDTFGHNVGDELLREIAQRLESCIQVGDMVSRMGGDEFTVLLTKVYNVEQVTQICRKILKSIQSPFLVAGQELHISTSIGISVYPDHGEHEDLLLKRADIAMYYAKQNGKNTYRFYSQHMDFKALEQLVLENKLHKAFAQNGFHLYYQPKFDIQTNQVSGAEALLRFHHPDFGTIQPSQLIPLAEATGMIIPLGEKIFRMACQQLKKWRDAGENFRISVNLSADQFRQENLVEKIKEVLEETELQGEWLELEITESSIMQNI